MNTLLKYLGVFILLIGVAILAIPTITGSLNNSALFIGLVVIILGYLAHIFLNKRFE
jgi:uncharacterized membrane protein HdeD (DUF308 family)